jgi:phosphate transport system permease protein
MGRHREALMAGLFLLTACLSVGAVALICLFLLGSGIPTIFEIGPSNFFAMTWRPSQGQFGILPMVLGSLYATAGAMVVGVPLGLLCAIYLSRFAPPRVHRLLQPGVTLLAGIPSIVYGFFGLSVLCPGIHALTGSSGKGLLTASLLLGLMILPTLISVGEAALNAVPQSYYEAALALGATHERGILTVVLPAGASGVLSGVILGIGRAIGETMAVVMVAGNQAQVPNGLLQGLRTMTASIVLEMGYASGLHRDALIATGVVLLVFILLLTACFSLLKRRARP